MDVKKARELMKVSWTKRINKIKAGYAGVFNQMCRKTANLMVEMFIAF